MNKQHTPPVPIQPPTPEEMQIAVGPMSMLTASYYAVKRAHYLGMARKPRDKKHLKFCLRELKLIDRKQEAGKGYTKIV